MAKLELTHVKKSFAGIDVVHDVSLQFDSGEFVVFVGPSGCGKSTLLRMIAGLEQVSGGQVLIDGTDVTETDPSKRGIAMVFQSYALYPHMTVEENMGFGLEMAGIAKAERQQMVRKAAEILHLEPYLQRKPKALSGGQRQRVAIGRAIVRNPKIFLFDEPLSNLDAELRVRMRLEIAKLHKDLGATMIYVTHDQVEAMTLASRIVVLRSGNVEQVGTPMDLYNDPDNVFVAGFIGSPKMNFVPARLLSRTGDGAAVLSAPRLGIETITVRPRNPAATLPENLLLGVRPESFGADPAGGGVPVSLRCEVTERLGNVSYLYSQIENGESLVAELRGQSGVRSGDTVELFIRPEDCFLFDPAGPRL